VPRITTVCICIYVFGCMLSLFKPCDSDFGIIRVAEITIGTTCTASCFHTARISFASSWYFFCFSVIVLARLCVFGIAVSIRKVFFVFLFVRVMSGRLKSIVLSVIMLRFQYSLKLSFSSTLLLLLLSISSGYVRYC
jgi:ABC-type dipeptide/oligopeptide/nickel transport system permease component